GERVAQKNVGITRQRPHAFLNARSARIVEANHRRAVAHRQVHDLADLEGICFREGAPKHGEVLSEHIDQTAINAPEAGDETVAGRPLILHPEIIAAVRDKFVELFKSAFIEQQRDALARHELAGLVFALAAFLAASGFRLGATSAQLRYGIAGFWVIGHKSTSWRIAFETFAQARTAMPLIFWGIAGVRVTGSSVIRQRRELGGSHSRNSPSPGRREGK